MAQVPARSVCSCAIALVLTGKTDPEPPPALCANLGGDTDTIGAMATAIRGALHGVNAIDPALKAGTSWTR
ncbi:ADP-ribosylglycohydrolase family protein [Shigella flexneri]